MSGTSLGREARSSGRGGGGGGGEAGGGGAGGGGGGEESPWRLPSRRNTWVPALAVQAGPLQREVSPSELGEAAPPNSGVEALDPR